MKAILILNKMPRDCPCCPVAHYNKLDEFTGCDIVGGKRYAMTTEEGYRYTSERPTWCPLKPMPKALKSASEYGSDEEYIKHLIVWKKEIDEILGEEEK